MSGAMIEQKTDRTRTLPRKMQDDFSAIRDLLGGFAGVPLNNRAFSNGDLLARR
jgi:hypothetical protein